MKRLLFTGADDVITFHNDSFTHSYFEVNIAQSNFINELTSRESYDVIFITTKLRYNTDFFWKFVKSSGTVVDTVEPDIDSDQYGAFLRLFYSVSVRHFSQFRVFHDLKSSTDVH